MFFTRRTGMQIAGVALLTVFFAGVAAGADWKALPGHVPAAVSHLNSLGEVQDTAQMRLAIGVPPRDPAGLDDFLTELYDPTSPNYRKYLTPEEFTARFGPTAEDYDRVIRFAEANGLTVVQTQGNRMVLDVAGPAAAVEKALHIRLKTYQHPTESRQFFAPDTDPTVDADLPVADIQGLTDFAKPHPRLKKANLVQAVAKDGTAPDGSGGYFGNDFRNAYASGSSLTGAGQEVGLLEFDGYYASDIASYASAAGDGRSSIPIQAVLLDGYNGTPTTGEDSGNGEVSLDIEQAMAMAPGLAKIVVFEAGPNGYENDILNSMVQNSGVKALACCWGWGGGPSTTTDNIFKEMAAQGQSFFNASGDSDAFTVGANSINGVDNPNNANAPSSCPYITEVGGTTLTMNGSGASYASEVVWNWGGGSGSSGGVSSSYTIPSWQAGVSMSANGGSTSQRNIPDVAFTADNVYTKYGNGGSGVFGGTSCAAPLWAGFMALVNQQAAINGNSAGGFINPAIYAIGRGQNTNYTYAECFHDTTSGNNFWQSSPAEYSATAGYDLCTGWGTPNGAALINALAGTTATLLGSTNTNPVSSGPTNTVTGVTNIFSISSPTGFGFSGTLGGPFGPGSGTFVLSNEFAAMAKWSLMSTSSWLTVSATNGALAGGTVTNVTVYPGTLANALKVGNYTTSLKYTNTASHTGLRIPVTLQVSQPFSLLSTQAVVIVGPVAGPFAPGSQTFTLVNSGGAALKWGAVNTATWLSISPLNGTLAAGGQVTVTVSVATAAKTLRAAIYTASLSFTNAGGVIAKVPFSLAIGQPLVLNGGFELGTFADWTESGNSAYSEVARANQYYVHTGEYGAQLGPSGAPGYLSQTVTTVPGQTYKLSLWLRNVTAQTPNWFQVEWNGAAVLELNDVTAKVWTNMTCLVTATSTSSALQLGFQDDPYYLGLDDVSLTAVASASVKLTVRKSDDFQLVWNTSSGSVYQTQYKTNLCQPEWIDLGGPVTATGDTMTVTDTNAFQTAPQKFYRMLAVPQ